MNGWSGRISRRGMMGAAGATTLVVGALGLQGFRGPWHRGYDPERFDARLEHLERHVADDLQLTAQQEPQFKALMARFRDVIKRRHETRTETDQKLEKLLESEPVNTDAVAAVLKQRIQNRVDPAAMDGLVNESVAFYRTLDARQQETVRKRMLRRLRWRLDN